MEKKLLRDANVAKKHVFLKLKRNMYQSRKRLFEKYDKLKKLRDILDTHLKLIVKNAFREIR